MARPRKNTADYFSHDAFASQDLKIKKLESKYGIAGYGFYFKMLELLCSNEDYEIDKPDQEWWFPLYASDWKLNKKDDKGKLIIIDIYKDCLKLNLFAVENKKLFSPSFKKRMKPLEEKRKKDRGKGDKSTVDSCKKVIAAKTPVSEAKTPVSEAKTTQSKVKYSKEKESIVKKSYQIFKNFFSESGNPEKEFDLKMWKGFNISKKTEIQKKNGKIILAYDEYLRKMVLLKDYIENKRLNKLAITLQNEIMGWINDYTTLLK